MAMFLYVCCLAVLLQAANALDCYACYSPDPNYMYCNDSRKLTDSKLKRNCPSDNDSQIPVCVKKVYTERNKTKFERSCSIATKADNGSVFFECSSELGLSYSICEICNTDRCNGMSLECWTCNSTDANSECKEEFTEAKMKSYKAYQKEHETRSNAVLDPIKSYINLGHCKNTSTDGDSKPVCVEAHDGNAVFRGCIMVPKNLTDEKRSNFTINGKTWRNSRTCSESECNYKSANNRAVDNSAVNNRAIITIFASVVLLLVLIK